jgi:CRP-like cAMP-binding protein
MKVNGLFRNAEETRHYSPGEAIFEEGDVGEEMFGIVSGEVELSVDGEVIAKLGADEVFGEMAVIDSSPRMATASAVSDAEIAVIDRRRFLFLVHETPMFALQVMSTLAERLRHHG